MSDVLDDFYRGNLFSRYDLESELEHWENIVKEYEDNDIYPGDSYYQDALGRRDALQEAVNNYESYYDEEGNFIGE